MRTSVAFACLFLVWHSGAAQDLVITNARIVDGTGRTSDRGSVVVTDGRILDLAQSSTDIPGAAELDANGMTLMPGLIDTHWHVLTGVYPAASDENVEQYMQDVIPGLWESLLGRGVTTILSVGDLFPNILELRRRLADGEMRGPRLLAVGPVFTGPDDWPTPLCRGNRHCKAKATAELTTTQQARAKVREIAAAGVDAVKLVYDDLIVPDVRIADDVVAAIADEARRHDLRVLAHISTLEETALHLVELGVRGLVHPVPLRAAESANGAQILRDLQIPVSTTVSVRTRAWRQFTGQEYSEQDEASFNQRLADIRYLWDAGVTVAFGTDTTTRQGGHEERFRAELRALNQVLSNQEVIASLTRNAAVFLGLDDNLGTLEPGKIADMILIDGNPLADISDLARVAVVIQGGRIIVDHR